MISSLYLDVANSDDMRLKLLDHYVNLSMTHADLAAEALQRGLPIEADHHRALAKMHAERAEGYT